MRQPGNARTQCGQLILSHLRMKVHGLIFDTIILQHMHVLCVLVCVNLGDEIILMGEKCKTREKFNFSKKW